MTKPVDNPTHEVHDVVLEDLEAAADMFDGLLDGTFYDDQAEAERYIKELGTGHRPAWAS